MHLNLNFFFRSKWVQISSPMWWPCSATSGATFIISSMPQWTQLLTHGTWSLSLSLSMPSICNSSTALVRLVCLCPKKESLLHKNSLWFFKWYLLGSLVRPTILWECQSTWMLAPLGLPWLMRCYTVLTPLVETLTPMESSATHSGATRPGEPSATLQSAWSINIRSISSVLSESIREVSWLRWVAEV